MVKRVKTVAKTVRASRLGLRLSEDVRKGLEVLATADGRTLSAYVERVLAEHVRTEGPASRKR